MKYTVTYACGHTERTDLYGSAAVRERRFQWLQTTLCAECYKAEQAAKRAAEAAAAIAVSAQAGLPALEGSEKQVAWAESIRRKYAQRLKSWNIDDIRKQLADIDALGLLEAVRRSVKPDATQPTEAELAAFAATIEMKLPRARAAIEVADRITTETSAKWYIDAETSGRFANV